MRQKVTVLAFLAVLSGFFFLDLFRSPDEFSVSERRRLAQFPDFTPETVLNGKFMDGFDDFSTDQASFREGFRGIKAVFDLNILRKSDNNNIFLRDGMVFKTEYPINERSVLRLCAGIQSIRSRYLDGAGVKLYYTIVPDKNRYLENSGHLILDYDRLEALICENIGGGMEYISLFGALSLEDYYRTDSHWKQERLGPAAGTLAAGMGAALGGEPFITESYAKFYGVYYGQSALNIGPDTISWLVSRTTEEAVVTSAEKPGEVIPVYDLTKLESADPYSLFMGGPAAIVTARNPRDTSGRELVIFRDSYASSLSPLLLDAYGTVTLIDLRYIHPDLLGDYIVFDGQDVLFMYSATVFNNSDSIRLGSSEAFVSPFVARGRLEG